MIFEKSLKVEAIYKWQQLYRVNNTSDSPYNNFCFYNLNLLPLNSEYFLVHAVLT